MSASSLTEKQRELLGFIRAWQSNEGTSPSFDEMREALALRSKSGVHRLIEALEERGFIRRLPNRARCIEILDQPALPDRSMLSVLSTRDLALEARRRGLVLGEYHRDRIKVGGSVKERRFFREIAA